MGRFPTHSSTSFAVGSKTCMHSARARASPMTVSVPVKVFEKMAGTTRPCTGERVMEWSRSQLLNEAGSPLSMCWVRIKEITCCCARHTQTARLPSCSVLITLAALSRSLNEFPAAIAKKAPTGRGRRHGEAPCQWLHPRGLCLERSLQANWAAPHLRPRLALLGQCLDRLLLRQVWRIQRS